MNGASRYRKRLDGETLVYMPPGVSAPAGGSFDLRVSLGGMDLRDAFHVTLPPRCYGMTLGGLFNEVFAEDPDMRRATLESLDIVENPDLPDMYGELLDIFDQWRRRDCSLSFFVNNGPQVELFDPAANHLSFRSTGEGIDAGNPALDIVVEQTYDVLAWFSERGGDRDELLAWLRGSTLLYFMDKRRFRLPLDPGDELDRRLLPIAERLASRNLVAPSSDTGAYEISEEGRRLLGEVIAETESYIDYFDVFKAVRYDADAQAIDFDTPRGQDLRVQVYEEEGLDAIRVVFLLRLYDGTLDTRPACWREEVHSEQFFEDILRPALDHQRADEALLGWIIESGFARNEELAERAREHEAAEDAVRRARW